MTPMMYQGYASHIEYSDEDGCFVGRVSGIRALITFHGESVIEVRHAFQEAIDFYLESCRTRGETPESPSSGRIQAKVAPDLHARALWLAKRRGKSLNQFVTEALERAVLAD
ncbi:MAG: type II toxin-antitoxin system HicB family antitoxin [Magnetococcus sp. YQC-9]